MRYFGTLLLIALVFGGFALKAQAATDTKTQTSQNQIRDNSMSETVTWGSILEQDIELALADVPSPADERDTSLLKWKGRQQFLWKNLPDGKFLINASAYTAAADECGKNDGITSSGVKVRENRTLACPPAFPFGVKIKIEGYGTYVCEDRGGAIKGNHFDIYMETKREAFAFGRRNIFAEVIE